MDIVHRFHCLQAEIGQLLCRKVFLFLPWIFLIIPTINDITKVVLRLFNYSNATIDSFVFFIVFNYFFENLSNVFFVSNEFEKVTFHEQSINSLIGTKSSGLLNWNFNDSFHWLNDFKSEYLSFTSLGYLCEIFNDVVVVPVIFNVLFDLFNWFQTQIIFMIHSLHNLILRDSLNESIPMSLVVFFIGIIDLSTYNSPFLIVLYSGIFLHCLSFVCKEGVVASSLCSCFILKGIIFICGY